MSFTLYQCNFTREDVWELRNEFLPKNMHSIYWNTRLCRGWTYLCSNSCFIVFTCTRVFSSLTYWNISTWLFLCGWFTTNKYREPSATGIHYSAFDIVDSIEEFGNKYAEILNTFFISIQTDSMWAKRSCIKVSFDMEFCKISSRGQVQHIDLSRRVWITRHTWVLQTLWLWNLNIL